MTALSEAIAARDELLASASRGATVTAQQARAAEQAVRDAESDDALAARRAEFAKAEADQAMLNKFAADAASINANVTEAVEAYLLAARGLAEAMAAARIAAEAVNAAGSRLAAADRQATSHNSGLHRAALEGNSALSQTHSSPHARALILGAEAKALLGKPILAQTIVHEYGPPPGTARSWPRVIVGATEANARAVLLATLAKAA